MTSESAKILELLANASFLYGPFFFALLFVLVVIRTAHSYYTRVCERSSPQASPEEKKTYQIFFHVSVAAGTLLVFTAVGWWIYAQLQRHTLEGVISGLDTTQTIITLQDNIYLRSVERDAGSGMRVKDYHFIIVRDNPFVSGQTFHLGFFPEQGANGPEKPKPVFLNITYSGRPTEKFRLSHSSNSFELTRTE